MNVSEFRSHLDTLVATNSRTEKKKIIRELADSPAAISFLSGSEYDDIGLGKKTVKSVASDEFGQIDGKPTVSENLEEFDGGSGKQLWELRSSMDALSDESGGDQKIMLGQLLREHDYPSVVAFAVLNDLGTGVSDTTIANALDLRAALPFHESVVDAVEVSGEPLTEPQVGSAFDPMLAKSESNMPSDLSTYVAQPKLDGYRLILHISSCSSKTETTAFTRRRNDVTESLPELGEIDWPEGEWIVDVEVIAETGRYSDTSERIGRKAENVEREVDMEFGVFDVIEHDGESLYERPFKERHGWVNVFSDLTPDDRVGALPIYTDEATAKEVSSDFEGLIWKDLEGPYEFGKRSKAWCKEKHTAETVDLRAVGFVEGEGRLDGTLGKIELATADGHSVGFTGSGLTDEQRDEIWANRDEYHGSTLEVEGEAFDKSIRFPIFQRWRDDDGEPDSLDRVESILPEA